jgi:hypothetical protein
MMCSCSQPEISSTRRAIPNCADISRSADWVMVVCRVLECPSGRSGRNLAAQEAGEETTTRQHGADGQVRRERLFLTARAEGIRDLHGNRRRPLCQPLESPFRGRNASHESNRGLRMPVARRGSEPWGRVGHRPCLLRQEVQPYFGLVVANPEPCIAVFQVRTSHGPSTSRSRRRSPGNRDGPPPPAAWVASLPRTVATDLEAGETATVAAKLRRGRPAVGRLGIGAGGTTVRSR